MCAGRDCLRPNRSPNRMPTKRPATQPRRKPPADSAAANVARLRELESFKRVVAPFDGVITARNTDIGALINAGQSAGAELFRVADTHKLRIYVQVPEAFAGADQTGPRGGTALRRAARQVLHRRTLVRTAECARSDAAHPAG